MLKRLLSIVLVLALPALCVAQATTATVRGQVTDPSGAVIPNATIIAKSAAGQTVTAKSDGGGNYVLQGLTPGAYTISATAEGFAPMSLKDVQVEAGTKSVPLSMKIEVEEQQVQVESEGNNVDVSASSNASSTTLKGKDLEALSDDPDEMASELEALAGPSAGPNGGQMYIDGFTGGQLPPKSSIREIRINSNPFSSEYDKLGYSRIEIFTKPGSNQWHGQIGANGNSSNFNSPNPFIHDIPDYYSDQFNGNLSGPLGKKASFFLNSEYRNIDDASVSNFTTSDPAFTDGVGTQCTPTATDFSCSLAVPNGRKRFNASGRLDYQVSQNNTATARYQFTHNSELNNINGTQFVTASQLYNSDFTEHTLQVSDTQTVSPHVINETRFQFRHFDRGNQALVLAPTVNVLGSFVGGGSSMGINGDTQDNYEIQNYTSMQHGLHFIKFGGRVRVTNDNYSTTGNFNGTYTFTSLAAFQAGTPSQYTVTTGTPTTSVTWADVGLYVEDEWRVKPNVSVVGGLRYETQNVIHERRDFAPRLSVSYGFNQGKNKAPRTVIRGGIGLFYDRFGSDLYLNAERLDGVTQQQYVVANPNFYPTAPPPASLTGAQVSPTVYSIAPHLHSPYTLQSAIGLEHQISKAATMTVTYLASRGFDQLLTMNLNAPLPGSYTPGVPGTGTFPLGTAGNVYQYESEGIFRQKQLIVNGNVRLGTRMTLGGFYTLSFSDTNVNGAGSFPSNPYNIMADYGPSPYNARHRFMMFGSLSVPHGIRLSPMVVFNSGTPFSITSGEDINNDSIYNDRPALASGPATSQGGPGVGACPRTATACGTPWGVFNLVPASGTPTIAANTLTGPSQFMMNLRLAKTFGFGKLAGSSGGGGGDHDHGPRGGGGPGGGLGPGGLGGGRGMGGFFGGAEDRHRYQLTFSVFGRNLFNNVNVANPVATLTSPLLGTSNSLRGGFMGGGASNRRIDLGAQFTF